MSEGYEDGVPETDMEVNRSEVYVGTLRQQAQRGLVHGHPAVFTWDDVDAIQEAIDTIEWRENAELRSLADRIAALLPPREKAP